MTLSMGSKIHGVVLICLLVAIPEKLYSSPRHQLIIWSIDGLASAYFTDPEKKIQRYPAWKNALSQLELKSGIQSTLPSVTFPAHTSIVTGKFPAEHLITGNHWIDPFGQNGAAWTWFFEDIGVKTLQQYARDRHLKTANILWPVTLGSKFTYSFPQFNRAKGSDETKLMRVLAGASLYDEVYRNVGVKITDYTPDAARVSTALYLKQKYAVDLTLLYTTDLDTIEHQYGAFSSEAYGQLEKIGDQLTRVIDTLRRENLKPNASTTTALLIVSDHGFMPFEKQCFPNAILRQMGYIDAQNLTWQFLFETSGGAARLVRHASAGTFDATQFATLMKAACPSIAVIGALDQVLYTRMRHEYSKQSDIFLLSSDQTSIGSAWSREPFDAEAKGFTHGFDNTREEMQTVMAFVVPGRLSQVKRLKNVSHVKDAFSVSCRWLGLKCKR